MSNIPYEQIPFMSPDSTRKLLNTNKKLFDNYTKKNYSETDLYGITNSGTVENFGAEVFMESRKLLNEHVEYFKDMYSSDFMFYFNMTWSPLTPTINQETVIQCILKNDVLLSNHTYKIIFNNVEEKYFIRSQSSSDPEVKKCKFYIAEDVHLLIDENTDILLSSENNMYTPCFFYNIFTKNYCEYNSSNKTLIVELFPKVMVNLPWIWISFKQNADSDKYPFNILRNFDMHQHDLISLGRDGHNMIYGYVSVYGEDNVPSINPNLISDENKWFLKCYPNIAYNEFTDDINKQLNWRIPIEKIQYCYGPSIGNNIFTYDVYITYTAETSILLYNKTPWQFRKPHEGDTDYDGIEFLNHVYAYIELSQFDINTTDNPVLKPAFIASQKYFTNERDVDLFLQNDSRAGIHIDTSSEYSDNGIPKKNGVIHELGDFDGLPEYFKYNLDKTIHRIHTEIYSIRQKTNIKQLSTQRGTAGLIFDTAIPQIEGDYILDQLTVCIKYDYSTGRTFRTISESEDKNNVLSEIVYVDKQNLGCSSEAKYMNNNKFLYHGNRTFSLGKTGLDKDKEIGRVFHISNDKAEYQNNEHRDINNRIPGRAIAMMSDIPTSFLQLTHIKGISPIIVIDKNYVRTECAFSKLNKQDIWNNITPIFVRYNNQYIFNSLEELSHKLSPEFMKTNYSNWINLTNNLNIYHDIADYTLGISNNGEGYAVNDILKFSIGGCDIKLRVTSVTSNGKLNNVSIIQEENNGIIDKSLFNTRITEYDIATIEGLGKSAKIIITISNNKWKDFQKDKGLILNKYDALISDSYNNLFIYRYNPTNELWEKYQQLTGITDDVNPYDVQNEVPQIKRSNKTAFLYNMLNNSNYNVPSFEIIQEQINMPGVTEDEINSGEDLSILIDYQNMNRLHGYYTFKYYPSTETVKLCCNYINNSYYNEIVLPRFNQVNTSNVVNYSNQIKIMNINKNSQVIPYIFNPNKTYKDSIINGEYKYLGELFLNDLFTFDIVENYVLKSNVYGFDIYSNKKIMELRKTLNNLSRATLIDMIEEDLDKPDILEYERTTYAYSKDELINYIIQRSYFDPIYVNGITSMIRKINDVVEKSVGGERLPYGEQQSGWFEWLTQYIRNDITIDGAPNILNELKIFKLNNTSTFNSNFKVYDEYDNDISNKCILIYNNSLFIYSNNQWINIRR